VCALKEKKLKSGNEFAIYLKALKKYKRAPEKTKKALQKESRPFAPTIQVPQI
jgi:hypothetical protein